MLAVSMSVMSSPKTCSWLTCRQLRPTNVPAGADVLTVNNFACTEWSLARIGQADRQLELVTAAARLARRAADDAAAAGRPVLVAGSLPPLRESYRAAAGLSDFELMQPQYNELAGALKPYCDLLLCETLASVAEGLAAATAASASGLPWWVSWTVEDRQDAPLLRSGEPLAAAVEAVAQLPGLAALLVNCSCPQAVAAALPVLAAAAPPGVLVGGFANGFKTTTSGGAAAGELTGRRAGHDLLDVVFHCHRMLPAPTAVIRASPTHPILCLQSGWKLAAALARPWRCQRRSTTLGESSCPKHTRATPPAGGRWGPASSGAAAGWGLLTLPSCANCSHLADQHV